MDLQLLSFLAAITALVISLVTLVRTRKAQEIAKLHSEYVISPKLTLSNMELYIFDDKDDKPAFNFSGDLNCHSSTAVKIIGIYLEFGDELDSVKRVKSKLVGPTYISEHESKHIETSATSSHTSSVSEKYGLSDVHYWLTVSVQGIDREEIITRYFLFYQELSTNNVSTRCPHTEYAL